MEHTTLLLVGAPFPETGGGARRALEVTRRLKRFNSCFDSVELVIPPFSRIASVEWENPLRTLSRAGVVINSASLRMLESGNIPLGLWEIRKYVREVVLQTSGNVLGIYSFHEWGRSVLTARYLAHLLHTPYVILLQLQPYYKSFFVQFSRNFKYSGVFAAVRGMAEWMRRKYIYAGVNKDRNFRGFVSVSRAPLVLAGLEHIRHVIPFPANAFEPEWLKARDLHGKDNCIVFFAQFMPEKGIYELPRILREISKKYPDTRLVICGRIYDKYEQKFISLAKRMGVLDRIEMRGFVPRDVLIRVVSHARLFIYPTHLDAYPLVLLESLAAGTPVVTYDIPAIRFHYDFPAVRIVREGDYIALARAALDILSWPEDKYTSVMNSSELMEFLRIHSSWDAVAKADFAAILSLLWGDSCDTHDYNNLVESSR